jgi:hypothetical protein
MGKPVLISDDSGSNKFEEDEEWFSPWFLKNRRSLVDWFFREAIAGLVDF